jgi:hypothetical protein
MAQTVPQQHPAVVLRAHYAHLRVLLVIALIALVAMAAAVVALATSDSSTGTGTTSAPAPITVPGPTGNMRYDGGPEEGSRGAIPAPGSNYNGPH